MTTSIARCQAAGLVFEADEAVAIAQQLITFLRDLPPGDEAAPYGRPATETVFLEPDGSVVCRSCRVTPAVSEIGIFLEQLLAPGSPRVPGPLRYTMARAVLNVDVPPFDSLEELSRDLSRHERGNRAEIVRRALARAHGPREQATMPVAERRRYGMAVTSLRRELREADVRLYQQNAGMRRQHAIIDLVAAAPAAGHGRRLSATAACVAAGLTLIGAGELMHLRSKPPAAPQAALVPAQIPLSDEPRVLSPQAIATIETVRPQAIAAVETSQKRGTIAVRDVVRTPAKSSRPARSGAVKPPVRRDVGTRRQSLSRPSRGVLDRLRLGWLRRAFGTNSSL